MRSVLRAPASTFAFFLVGALASAALPGAAHAQDAAAADVLFREGKALMEAGKVAEACPKFEASHAADASLGTLLNLADCFEQQGRLASAHARWSEAFELAKKQSDDRASFAAERRDALTERVPEVMLQVVRGPEPLLVAVAGRKLDDTSLGLPIRVDPGDVEVTVSRGDTVLVTKKLRAAESSTTTLPLDLAAIAKANPAKVKREAAPVDPTQNTVGLITMAVGLAGLGAFVVLEGAAFAQRAEADGTGGCVDDGDTVVCSPQGIALVERAGDYAEVGQWVGVASAAVFAVGLTVWLTAPSEGDAEAAAVAVAPWVLPGGGGIVIGGSL